MVREFSASTSFFNSSQYYKQELRIWGEKNNAGPFISTFVEIRWFSFVKMCMGIVNYEKGFAEMLKLFGEGKGPRIKESIGKIILSKSTFQNAHFLVQITKPISDTIAHFGKELDAFGPSLAELLFHSETLRYHFEGI